MHECLEINSREEEVSDNEDYVKYIKNEEMIDFSTVSSLFQTPNSNLSPFFNISSQN
jgi:ABC-type dipeptide/oligopeptide/nickel transport system ATPase component